MDKPRLKQACAPFACRSLGIVLLSWLASPALAAPDLIAVYSKALDSNPDYQSAQAQFRQAQEARPQALAKLLPQLGAGAGASLANQSVSGQFFNGLPTFDIQVGGVSTGVQAQPSPGGTEINRTDEFHQYNYGATLSQVVFNRPLFLALDEADLQVGKAGLLMSDAQDQLRLGVVQAYFEALAADDHVRFAQAEKQAIGQLLEQTKNRYASGLVTDVDVKSAQAEYDRAQTTLINAQNEVAVSRVQLELLTGGDKVTEVKPLATSFKPLPPDPNSLQVWIDRAQTQNLKLQAARYGTQIADKELSRARGMRWPTLDAAGSYVYEYADGGISNGIGAGNNHGIDERIGLKLKIPIYTGGAIDSAVRYAVAGYERATADEGSARFNATKDVQVAYLNMVSGLSKTEAARQALESTKAAEEAARVGYDVGTKTDSDVLLAVRSRYQAESDYAQSRYDNVVNSIKLRQAAGTLNHADLLAINRWLQ